MLGNAFKVLISVRAKLFFGFCAMAVIISLLGGYSYFAVTNAGSVVKDTFDRPLMAINYARSASQIFAGLESDVQRKRHLAIMGDPIDTEIIESELKLFREDLKIARERSIAPKAEMFFSDVDDTLLMWSALVLDAENLSNDEKMGKADDMAAEIIDNLDIIVELQTNESFRNRESAITTMEKVRNYSLAAVFLALLLSLIGSTWLALTIIKPLKAAAEAARKISAGNFETEIPRGGDDETGVLLKTMTVMQKKIRHRMEKEQNSRELAQTRLAESLENSKDAILLTNNIGQIIVANGQVKSMLPSLADVTLLGSSFADFFNTNGTPIVAQCKFHADNNELEFADGRWARINASDTQEGGRLFIWTDITKSKERSERLRIARDQAEAANEAKTLFLAAMSHELRTPLNAVIGLSDVIAMQSSGKPDQTKTSEMAQLISKNGSHLLHIVTDVLSIAEGEDSKTISADMEDIDLIEALKFGIDTVKNDAEKNGVRIIWGGQKTPINMHGDQSRLQQLFLNLLSNAVTFNNENGTVKVMAQVVKNKAVIIDIIDTGIGIPEDAMEAIFEPFVQVDKGYSRNYDGVGLGLSVAKQMLDLHKGRINIKSEFGKGTHVRVALPIFTKTKDEGRIVAA